MSLLRTLFVGYFAVATTGCFSARSSAPDTFVHQAARNGVQQNIRPHDDSHFVHAMRKQAEAAFTQRCVAGAAASEPYHEGFVEGFIDFVEAGGSGEPPFLPPFRYRLTEHRTAEGQAVIRDWYTGFRDGSAAARTSGLRELNYVPLPGSAAPIDNRSTPEVPADVQMVQPFATDRTKSPWEIPGAPPTMSPAKPETGPPPRTVPEMPVMPARLAPPVR